MAVALKGPSFPAPHVDQTLFGALLDARRRHGGSTLVLQDRDEKALSYDALLRAALAISAPIARRTSEKERVGVLLPTGAPAMIALFALHAIGRTPVLLNYSADAATMDASCRLAGVRTVLSSRRFIRAAGLEEAAAKLAEHSSIAHLEDLRDEISALDKLAAGVGAMAPALVRRRASPRDPALILFTSGTTGAPKGAALSHANILANIEQCRAFIPFDPEWVFFDPLPTFHSFGLTCGALLPILGGMKTVLYPSPLDYAHIPTLIRKSGANVLICTRTFAKLYARKADEQTFENLRYVVLGGEPVDERTRALYAERSSAEIVEGYGVTEASPVIAVNHPDDNRPGTVGKLLPGMEARLEEVPGIGDGKQLWVRGPNVMIGYLDPEAHGEIRPPADDWLDTGDLVTVDDDGFITVTGRVKRFARIGAEMVSLEAVEAHASAVWPDAGHAAVMFKRSDGEEAIALVTDQVGAGREALTAWASEHGVSRLAVPRRVLVVDELPRIATGTPDYAAVRRILKDELGLTTR